MMNMGTLNRLGKLASVTWIVGGIALACGGESDGSADNTVGGAGGKGGSGATGAAGTGGGGTSCSDKGDCDTGQYCSVAGVCVADGSCGATGDCASGEICSSTGNCIAEGTCESAADCAAGLVCDDKNMCVPGGGCGAQEFTIEAVPPNMMLVLDRSCSMRRDLKNKLVPAGPNKWTLSVAAINQLTTNFLGQIRWGLILFPDTSGGKCGQGAPAVTVGPSKENQIQKLLTDALKQSDPQFPDGPCVTNIDTAMQQAGQQPELQDSTRANYAVLITDGKQAGCNNAGGDKGTEQILATMHSGGVSTFVVGFGGAIDPVQMDKFAVAGGVPKSGTPKYYQADNAAQLQQSLGTIAGSIVGCTFKLNSTPPDPSKVFAFFDNQSVPRDPTKQNGWEYDSASNQITFYGSDCDKLKKQQVNDIDVVFGCNQPTPQ